MVTVSWWGVGKKSCNKDLKNSAYSFENIGFFFFFNLYAKMSVAWDGTKGAVFHWLCVTASVPHQVYDVV